MSPLNHIPDFLNAFKQGREEGFNHFFNTLYKPLYFFATRYVKDSAAAEDIITDSFIRLWDKREIFETEQGIKAYLYKSVYNASIRWLQNQQRKTFHLSSYTKQNDTTEQPYLDNIIKAETINQNILSMSDYKIQKNTTYISNNFRINQLLIPNYLQKLQNKKIVIGSAVIVLALVVFFFRNSLLIKSVQRQQELHKSFKVMRVMLSSPSLNHGQWAMLLGALA